VVYFTPGNIRDVAKSALTGSAFQDRGGAPVLAFFTEANAALRARAGGDGEGKAMATKLAITCGDPAGVGPGNNRRLAGANRAEAKDVAVIGPAAWLASLDGVAEFRRSKTTALGRLTVKVRWSLGRDGTRRQGARPANFRASSPPGYQGRSRHRLILRADGFFRARWGGEPVMGVLWGQAARSARNLACPAARGGPAAWAAFVAPHGGRGRVALRGLTASGGRPRIGVCGLIRHGGARADCSARQDSSMPALKRLRAEFPGSRSASQATRCLRGARCAASFDVSSALYTRKGSRR